VWFGDGRFFFWSDIPTGRIMKWEEETGAISVFRHPSHNSNGNTRDRQKRLVTCEHDTRRVTRTEHDGTITVVADRYDGKPLNSFNDVVCRSDGSIWFSDPPYGILGYYENHRATPELPTNVYRVDPADAHVTVITRDLVQPNGLTFSADESLLYVVEGGRRSASSAPTTSWTAALGSRTRDAVDAGDGTPDGLRSTSTATCGRAGAWARRARTASPS
jgi:gluconolactonase